MFFLIGSYFSVFFVSHSIYFKNSTWLKILLTAVDNRGIENSIENRSMNEVMLIDGTLVVVTIDDDE